MASKAVKKLDQASLVFFFENQSSVKVCNRPKLSVTTMVLSIHNHRSFHENRIWLRSDRWREDLQYLSHYVCSTTEYYEEKVSLLSTNLLKGTIKNSQQHFVICHTHTQYRQYLFLKKPDLPSLQNCNLVQIYQRAKNAIKYQVPKQKKSH